MPIGPGSSPRSTEQTRSAPPRFVIIGAGMAGILSGIRLLEAGHTNFTIYEKADRIGGTWRENTYPGIACDVPSHLYSYSFAPNPDWSHVFSPGGEILEYFEGVARDRNVDEYVKFSTEIERLEFSSGRWQITTADGGSDEADFVIAATGVLHHPKYPEIDGLETFAGSMFHSARWDHSVKLDGKRVGVIGTGSSAVQIVSAIVDDVASLTMFQRTPQWILPMANPEISVEDRARYRDEPDEMGKLRADLSKTFADHFANAVVDAESPQMKLIEEVCRANLESSVTDPDLREKLRPEYRAACKRLIASEDFYDAITAPHAHLVTDEIEAIEPAGVRTRDGAFHELDVLVLATGFSVDRFMRPIEVVGRAGKALNDVWADRPSAYLAVAIPDFPNLFMLNGPNGPVGNFSLIEVAELQWGYIWQLIEQVLSGECVEVSPTRAAAARFEIDRTEAAKKTVWVTGCRSWYLDDRGVPAAWPWTFDRFREDMASPMLADFELVG